MMLTYNGPFDEIEVPALGLVLKRGDDFEVGEAAADQLLRQADYLPADDAARDLLAAIMQPDDPEADEAPPVVEDLTAEQLEKLTNDQLREIAESRDIDLAGATRKDKIIAALLGDHEED